MARVGVIETDHLVVGAGAAGMAFTDTLVTESDADVVLVDRHTGPAAAGTTPMRSSGCTSRRRSTA